MKAMLERFKSLRLVRIMGFNRVVLIGVIILLCLIFQVLSGVLNHGNVFLTYARFTSAINYGYFIGFLALGVTFVIATGGIDFSVGPVMFAAALIVNLLVFAWCRRRVEAQRAKVDAIAKTTLTPEERARLKRMIVERMTADAAKK